MQNPIKKILNNKNFNNSFWSTLDVILYPLFFIVTTPFFIRELGTELFGIWLLMTSINVTLQVLNFGIGSALIFFTAKYLTEKKTKRLYKIYNSILSLSIFLLPIIMLFGFLISQIFIQTDFFKISSSYQSLAVDCVYLSAIIAFLKIMQTILMSILNGKEIYRINTMVNTVNRVLILLFACILIFLKYSVYEILVVSIGVNLVSLFVYYFAIKKHFTAYSFKFEFSKSYVSEVFIYGFWIWVQSIFSIVSFQIDKFFVTAINGPTLLVYYSLSSTIVNQMHMVYSALSAWLFPRISSLLAKGKEFISLYVSVRSLVLSFAYITIIILFFIKRELLVLWIGEKDTLVMLPIFKFFLIYEVIYVQTILPSFLLQGMKKVKIVTVYTITYKLILIIGMSIAYFKGESVQTLLVYMSLPLYFSLPILHFYINKNSIKLSSWYESFVIFIPSFLLAGIILVEDFSLKMLFVALFLISTYFVYIRRINFQKLKEVEA